MGGKSKKIPAVEREEMGRRGISAALKWVLPEKNSHAIMKQNRTAKCFCAQRREIWTSN